MYNVIYYRTFSSAPVAQWNNISNKWFSAVSPVCAQETWIINIFFKFEILQPELFSAGQNMTGPISVRQERRAKYSTNPRRMLHQKIFGADTIGHCPRRTRSRLASILRKVVSAKKLTVREMK